jgi:hypothetical protein
VALRLPSTLPLLESDHVYVPDDPPNRDDVMCKEGPVLRQGAGSREDDGASG